MGLFDGVSKDDLEARILQLEKDLAVKEELLTRSNSEVDHLRQQVNRLQDAIIAVQHPEAYRELKDDQLLEEGDVGLESLGTPEERTKLTREAEVQRRYMEMVEGPTFRDADELYHDLGRMIGTPENESIHDNSES